MYLASIGHVLYATLSVGKFKWLTRLTQIYKEAVHEVGVGTDGPLAQIKFLEVSLKLKIIMKCNLN